LIEVSLLALITVFYYYDDNLSMAAQQHSKAGKHPNDSRPEMTIMMLPSDANPKGNVFGGVILKHVDLIAGLCAKRHAGRPNIVTASKY
jgi:acyl-CoA hydrolase